MIDKEGQSSAKQIEEESFRPKQICSDIFESIKDENLDFGENSVFHDRYQTGVELYENGGEAIKQRAVVYFARGIDCVLDTMSDQLRFDQLNRLSLENGQQVKSLEPAEEGLLDLEKVGKTVSLYLEDSEIYDTGGDFWEKVAEESDYLEQSVKES